MTLKKAMKRYPEGTRVQYLGDRKIEEIVLEYGFFDMWYKPIYHEKNDKATVVGYKTCGEDCIGLFVEFDLPHWLMEHTGIEPLLLFKSDIFIRI